MKAIHVWIRESAKELNKAGISMQMLLDEIFDLEVTEFNFKENVWKGFQSKLFGKVSTTELDTVEVQQIYETINRELGEKCGVVLPAFPSWQNQGLE